MQPKALDIIYNADCAKVLNSKRKIPDDSIDLIVTSPPYAQQRKSSYGGIAPDRYVDWFLPIAQQLQRVLKSTGSFILNIKEDVKNCERQTYVLELILELKKQGWFWIEEYCWYKKNSYPGRWPNRFRDTWERCLHFTKSKKFNMYQDAVKVPIGDWAESRFKSMTQQDFIRSVSGTNSKFGRNVSNWLERKTVYPHNVIVLEKENRLSHQNLVHFSTECSNRNHSAVFPIQLPAWFIKLFTQKDDVVLDPFIGIGTTALASTLLKRKFIGIEIVKEYCDEALENIKELKTLINTDSKKLPYLNSLEKAGIVLDK